MPRAKREIAERTKKPPAPFAGHDCALFRMKKARGLTFQSALSGEGRDSRRGIVERRKKGARELAPTDRAFHPCTKAERRRIERQRTLRAAD
jgi:hypothetical protein